MAYFSGFSSVPKFVEALTLNPANVPANSVSVETFTVNGLEKGQMIPVVDAPDLEAGLVLLSARISANDTLELAFQNVTGSAINPASQTFNLLGL